MAGRLVNVTGEVLQVTHNEDLRAVFFNSPGEELGLLVIVFFFYPWQWVRHLDHVQQQGACLVYFMTKLGG